MATNGYFKVARQPFFYDGHNHASVMAAFDAASVIARSHRNHATGRDATISVWGRAKVPGPWEQLIAVGESPLVQQTFDIKQPFRNPTKLVPEVVS